MNTAHNTATKELLHSLRYDLQDALCFAELIELYARPDAEVYKDELYSSSALTQRRLRNAIEKIDDVIGEEE